MGRYAQDTHSTDQRRHLWRSGPEDGPSPIELRCDRPPHGHVVAESIGVRFQWGEGVCIRCSAEASVRPGRNGTTTECPAAEAAASIAALPAKTIRSAKEI